MSAQEAQHQRQSLSFKEDEVERFRQIDLDNNSSIRRRVGKMVPKIASEDFSRRNELSEKDDQRETSFIKRSTPNGDAPPLLPTVFVKSHVHSDHHRSADRTEFDPSSNTETTDGHADAPRFWSRSNDNKDKTEQDVLPSKMDVISADLESVNSLDESRDTNLTQNDELDETNDSNEKSLLLPNADFMQLQFDDCNTDKGKVTPSGEGSLTIAFQVFFPFLVAGIGTVSAGLLLDVVQHWKVFTQDGIPELFILVPALLGLKGNLEMTLASRLSTAANLGSMDCAKEQAKLIAGNMILTQAQALVVAALASIAAVVFGWVLDGHFDIHHAWLLAASSLVTASLASAVLGGIMIGVIVGSRKCGINPDNVATPIAASLGDLVTLALLASISMFLYGKIGTHYWIAPLICVLCIVLLPLWLYISHHNKYTHNVLYTGWTPVIMAMCISSGGGLILSYVVARYHGIAVFNPVINGVGGNLVAVQASRISTHLHKVSVLGKIPPGVKYGCITTFCTGGGDARAARVLLFMSIPGHAIFLSIIAWLKAGHTSLTPVFIGFYLLAGVLQVAILLFVGHWFVYWMWKRKNDPDNFSIPYLTALGDLLGTALLAVAFHVLWLIGDRDADVGD